MSYPRIIVNASPLDYVLVGRVVRTVTDPAYTWPADNIACIQFGDDWGCTFSAIRRKSCITIYGPPPKPENPA